MSCGQTVERWNLGRSRWMRSVELSFAVERCSTAAGMSAACVFLLINNHTTPSFHAFAILAQSVAIPSQCDAQRSGVRPSTIAHFQSLFRIVSARLPRQKSPSHPTMEARSCSTQTLISPCSRPPQTISKNSSRFSNVSLSDRAQRDHFSAPDVPCPASPPLRNKSLDTDQIAGKGFMSFSTSSGFIWQHKERS